MMKYTFLPFATLALVLTGTTITKAQYGPPQPRGYDEGPGAWNEAPREFQEFGRLGFHDGIDGARHDIENHRRPDVRNRDEFRHPHVPRYARDEYQDAFRRGYSVGIQHLLGGPYHPF